MILIDWFDCYNNVVQTQSIINTCKEIRQSIEKDDHNFGNTQLYLLKKTKNKNKTNTVNKITDLYTPR